MRRLRPKRDATILKPLVQLFQILEDRHDLPQPVPGIPDILLNLALLPARRWIAKLWLKNIVAGHGLEARVDIALLAATNTINCCLHVVVNPTSWDTAEHAEGVPVRIKR